MYIINISWYKIVYSCHFYFMKTKQLFYVVALLLNAQFVMAQDSIIFRNGTEKCVKIEEINDQEVKYRTDEQAPLMVQPKTDFLYLKLANGERMVFDESTTNVVTPVKLKAAWGLQISGGLSLYNLKREVGFGSDVKNKYKGKYSFGTFVEFPVKSHPTTSFGCSLDASYYGSRVEDNYGDKVDANIWLIGLSTYVCYRHKAFYCKAGFRFDMLVSARLKDNHGDSESMSDYCNTLQPGTTAAFGVTIPNSRLDISIGIDSYFTKLVEEGEGNLYSVGLQLSYRFN